MKVKIMTAFEKIVKSSLTAISKKFMFMRFLPEFLARYGFYCCFFAVNISSFLVVKVPLERIAFVNSFLEKYNVSDEKALH